MAFTTLRYLLRSLKCRYRDHRTELDALLRGLAKGEVAIDVGANKGAFLWHFARRVGPAGRVVAIEPQPALAAYLRTVVGSLGLRQVEIHAMAASDRQGRLPLHVPPAGTSPGATLVQGGHVPHDWTTVEVPTETLDALLASESRRVAAMKVDVEGFEPEVFAGAEAILRAHRPVIVFECEERHLECSRAATSVSDVIAWLTARNYGVSFVHRGAAVDAGAYRPAVHQCRDIGRVGERFWDAPDYCNNFIAVPH
ncbi:MAG: FkbM family methyltransferase [Phycisphaerae bacterium]|jgi:FkbM family methyltransferase|nr:FkbM family methyltransferase [Phycisphaerae bacterium]